MAEHLPVGLDLLAVTRVRERLEADATEPVIVAPAFGYGVGSHAVAGPVRVPGRWIWMCRFWCRAPIDCLRGCGRSVSATSIA